MFPHSWNFEPRNRISYRKDFLMVDTSAILASGGIVWGKIFFFRGRFVFSMSSMVWAVLFAFWQKEWSSVLKQQFLCTEEKNWGESFFHNCISVGLWALKLAFQHKTKEDFCRNYCQNHIIRAKMNTFRAKICIEKKLKLSTVLNNNDVFGTKAKSFYWGCQNCKKCPEERNKQTILWENKE